MNRWEYREVRHPKNILDMRMVRHQPYGKFAIDFSHKYYKERSYTNEPPPALSSLVIRDGFDSFGR
jgi:hypothetical protein